MQKKGLAFIEQIFPHFGVVFFPDDVVDEIVVDVDEDGESKEKGQQQVDARGEVFERLGNGFEHQDGKEKRYHGEAPVFLLPYGRRFLGAVYFLHFLRMQPGFAAPEGIDEQQVLQRVEHRGGVNP